MGTHRIHNVFPAPNGKWSQMADIIVHTEPDGSLIAAHTVLVPGGSLSCFICADEQSGPATITLVDGPPRFPGPQ
jgi:hypothetical protein